MSEKAKELLDRFNAINDELISLVEKCSDEDWKKVVSGEEWTVGVVMRHVVGAHFGMLLDMAKNIVAGNALPEMSMDQIDQMNAKHAQDHANCTKEEVLEMFRKNGASLAEFVNGLDDEDLAKSAYFSLAGSDINTKQMIKIIINGGTEHLTNIKATVS
jgi:hypothetical protein